MNQQSNTETNTLEVLAKSLIRMPDASVTKTTFNQLKIIQCIANGLQSKEISSIVALSPRTVEQHIISIRRMIGAKTQAQLVSIAYQKGILKIENSHSTEQLKNVFAVLESFFYSTLHPRMDDHGKQNQWKLFLDRNHLLELYNSLNPAATGSGK